MTSGGGAPVREWWREPFRMFQTNLREIDAATLDVDRTLDYLEDFGADAWLLSVGGIVSNYPTDLDAQTRNPALAARASGDLVGDVTTGASARGIRVLARMDFSKIDRRRAEHHPEWCFVDPEGQWQTYNGLTSVCPSGDYYQSHIFDVIAEILDRYPIDGFFFNWWSFNEIDYSRRYRGVCQCASCRRGFAEFAPGAQLPVDASSPTYDRWVAFTDHVLEDIGARMRAHIAARAPQAAFVQGDSADIVFHEANNAVGRPLWHHRTADEVSAARTRRHATPVLTNSVAFVDMPYRLASEDPQHFAQHLLQAIARGANPSTYIMGSPVDSPYECLDVAAEVTRFHRDNIELYRDAVPDADMVLVRPDRASVGGADLADALEEYRGIHAMLVQSHVPFDVVDARFLGTLDGQGDSADLAAWRAVILPGLGALAADAVARLDAFAAAGGLVVTTGSSGFDGGQAQLTGSPAERLAASFAGVEELLSFHIRLRDDEWGDPVAVVGELHLADPAPSAQTLLPVVGRAPFGPPEKCYGNESNGRWGALSAEIGAGRIVVVPWTIGRSWRETGADRLRSALVAVLDGAAGAPVSLGGTLSGDVEVVLSRAAAGRVAHLLNRSGDRTNRFAPVAGLREQTVVLPWPGVAEVRAAVGGTTLTATPVDGGIAVTIPALERFEVLVGADGGRVG